MTKEQKNQKFGTAYQNSKWKSVTCKLTLSEVKDLNKFLSDKGIGFTEFVRIAIQYFSNKEIKKEYKIK